MREVSSSKSRKQVTVHSVGLTQKQRQFLDRQLAAQGISSQHFDTLDELPTINPHFIIAPFPKHTREMIRKVLPDPGIDILCVKFPDFDGPPFEDDSLPPNDLAAPLTGFDLNLPMDDDNPWIKRPN